MTVAVSMPDLLEGLGNDLATSFSFSPMTIYEASDMTVTLVTAAGLETPVTLGVGPTNFALSVAAYPGTGSVIYPADQVTPMPTGDKIVMKPVFPVAQLVNLSNQGGYYPEVLETALDRLLRISKQQQEEIDRSFKSTVGQDFDVDQLIVDIANAEAFALAAQDARNTAATYAASANSSAIIAAAAAAHDIPFIAGFSETMTAEDLTVRTYGELVVARPFSITDVEGRLLTACSGGTGVIVDIEKNGLSSVFNLNSPQFDPGSFLLSDHGTLRTDGTEDFAAGDRLTFKVLQVGSTIAGARMMFTVKGDLL